MDHVLIIGGTRASVDLLDDQLWDAGYHSIIAVRNMHEARMVAGSVHPKLIIVVPQGRSMHAADELCQLSETTGAPIIVATADPATALDCLGPSVSFEGPYPAHAVATAAEFAMARSLTGLAHAA